MTDPRHAQMTELPFDPASGHRGSFLRGLVGGALIGAAAGLIFAPGVHAALRTMRRQVRDAAIGAGSAVADDLRQKGRGAYGKALSMVMRGAEDVKARVTEAQAELDRSAAVHAHTRTS